MRLLLDTHVWLWWQMEPARIKKKAHAAITDTANEVYLSAVSTWEMAIKIAAGKLQLPQPVEEMVPEALHADTAVASSSSSPPTRSCQPASSY